MGACAAGYHDLKGGSADGCEYACVSTGEEICDGIDNDCNGIADENTDSRTDPLNCGQCGRVCPLPPHANAVCASGQCSYSCAPGFYDNNGQSADGCEAPQCVPSSEVCDGRDNDCDCSADSNGDGVVCGPGDDGVDEGFDKTQAKSCGPYCTDCGFAHATAVCEAGSCALGQCESGWHDADGLANTGCEYACVPSGEELCDTLDNDCDGAIDEGSSCVPLCPIDMVPIGVSYCIDKYEASHLDSTAEASGSDDSIALSRPGVLPWMVNPMSNAHLAEFESACAAAGKHLCTSEEWFAACTGVEQSNYVYGNVFDREACNCVDSFCDDYCADHAIDATQCKAGADCGYTYNCYHPAPTAQFAACTNAYGTFDINGNVWEVVKSSSDARGFEVRGGAFNCANAAERVSCSFNAGWSALYAGFRCCKTIAS